MLCSHFAGLVDLLFEHGFLDSYSPVCVVVRMDS